MLFVSPGSPAKLCCSPHRSLLALLLMMVAALCSRGECPLRRERGARASCRGTVLSRQRAAAAHADTSPTRGRSSAPRVPQQRVLSSPSLVLSSPSPHPPHLRAMGPGEICAWAAPRAPAPPAASQTLWDPDPASSEDTRNPQGSLWRWSITIERFESTWLKGLILENATNSQKSALPPG